MKLIAKLISALFYPFIGRFNWTPAPWMAAIGRFFKAKPFMGLLFMLLLWGGVGLYAYLQWLPKPAALKAVITVPAIPGLYEDRQADPTPLFVRFQPNQEMIEGEWPSPAAIELLDKPLHDGVTIEPKVAGEWRWLNEATLQFKPLEHWPANTDYTVVISPRIMAKGVKLEQQKNAFTTAAFATKVYNTRLHKDPFVSANRKVVASIEFSHPVSEDDLKALLAVTLRDADTDIKSIPKNLEYELKLEPHGRRVHVHSQRIDILEQPQTVNVAMRAGRLGDGKRIIKDDVAQKVRIPDVSQFFRVTNASSRIINNADGEPEQVLQLSFSDDADFARVADKLSLLAVAKPPKQSRWASAGEIDPETRRRATPIAVKRLEQEGSNGTEHSYLLDVPSNSQLLLLLEKGVKSESGFALNSPYEALITAPSYPREANVMGEGGVIALSGDRRLSFQTRGVNSIRVTIERVLADQLNHLISQTHGDINNPSFYNWNFDQSNISVADSRIIPIAAEHPKKAQYSSLNLQKWLDEIDGGAGLFFVSVQGWDKRRGHSVTSPQKRLILVTDLGIISKQNADYSREVFVQSLAAGEPVLGAEVQVLAKNGQVIATRYTDVDGHASFENMSKLSGANEPTVYVVSDDDDVSFLPYQRWERQLDLSRFDVGGEYGRHHDDRYLRALVFTDRGIYRPGELVNIASIAKNSRFGSIEGLPIRYQINDPRGRTVLNRKLNLTASGLETLQHQLTATDPTGQYRVTVQQLDNRGYVRDTLGSVNFSVEEFQPDTMKINTRITPSKRRGWVESKQLSAEVELQNLFGTAAQDRRVTAELSLQPAAFAFRQWADYRFADPYADGNGNRDSNVEMLDELRTNADGKAVFPIDLGRYADGAWRLSIEADGYEAGNGRSVTARDSLLVSPAKYLVGVKADGDLGYIKRETQREIHWQAINSDLEAVAVENLKLRLNLRRYVSTLIKQNDGTYAYQSRLKRELQSEQALNISAEGHNFELPTLEAGDFELDVVDAQERLLSRVNFTVIGDGNITASLEKNAELDIKLNRKDYAPGDEIEVAITAPYTGAGLITIESDRVHAWQWFQSDSLNSVQSITVPDELEGNAYLNVAFVRGIDSPSIFTSPLSYAVQPFSIDRSQRRIDIDLDVPAKATPGEVLRISYKTNRPGKILVYAVDEGVLQVAGYRTPDPLAHFFRKRALQVSTQQMADLLMPEYSLIRELAAPGGGAMADMMARELLGANLNPFSRKVPKTTAFWSGVLDADEEQRQVEFLLPERFNGQLRVMAVAVADGAVGSDKTSNFVRANIILSPRLITAAAPSDEFNLAVNVANTWEGTADGAVVNFAIETSDHLQLLSGQPAALTLAEGNEQKFNLKLKALEQLGNASVTVTATATHPAAGETRAKMTETMSVRPASAYQHEFRAGSIDDKTASFQLTRQLYEEFADRTMAVSVSPLVLATGLNDYLKQYPHACTEQIVSKQWPVLALNNYPAMLGGSTAEVRTQVDATLKALQARQLSDGSFGLWPGDNRTHHDATLHASQFLITAAEAAYSVDPAMLSRAKDFLKRFSSEAISGFENARQKAQAIYLLTRQGIVATNQLTELHEWLNSQATNPDGYAQWKEDLISLTMAAAYKRLQKEDLAKDLASGYQFGDRERPYKGLYDSQLSDDAEAVALLAEYFPTQLQAVPGGAIRLLAEPLYRNQYHSYSAAQAIRALAAYTNMVGLGQDENIEIKVADASLAVQAATITSKPFPKAQLNYDTAKVELSGTPPMFYALSDAGFDRDGATQTSTSAGIEIIREYLNADGNAVTQLKQGDKFTVRLRVRSLGGVVPEVAISDLLPGGIEVDRDSLRKNRNLDLIHYIDIREDRTVFYGTVKPDITTLQYQAVATTSGEFAIPPIYVEAMYDPLIRARSAGGRLTVHSQ